jgi:uncharacterized protein
VVIGALEVHLSIMGARSLKEKRKVLKSLKDRFSKLNVSVAEVGDQDKWQACTLAFAMVSNDSGFVNSALDRIAHSLSEHPDVELIDHHVEILHI